MSEEQFVELVELIDALSSGNNVSTGSEGTINTHSYHSFFYCLCTSRDDSFTDIMKTTELKGLWMRHDNSIQVQRLWREKQQRQITKAISTWMHTKVCTR